VRVLLDENLPHDLIAFVTMDRKLEREHDLTVLPFGVIVAAQQGAAPDEPHR